MENFPHFTNSLRRYRGSYPSDVARARQAVAELKFQTCGLDLGQNSEYRVSVTLTSGEELHGIVSIPRTDNVELVLSLVKSARKFNRTSGDKRDDHAAGEYLARRILGEHYDELVNGKVTFKERITTR